MQFFKNTFIRGKILNEIFPSFKLTKYLNNCNQAIEK